MEIIIKNLQQFAIQSDRCDHRISFLTIDWPYVRRWSGITFQRQHRQEISIIEIRASATNTATYARAWCGGRIASFYLPADCAFPVEVYLPRSMRKTLSKCMLAMTINKLAWFQSFYGFHSAHVAATWSIRAYYRHHWYTRKSKTTLDTVEFM